jgi:Zn-dependent protease
VTTHELKRTQLEYPLLRLACSIASFFVSICVLEIAVGWYFATDPATAWLVGLGVAGLLFLHEAGHAVAIKRVGYGVTVLFMLPLRGCFLGFDAEKDSLSREDEATVNFWGPVVGLIPAGFLIVAEYFGYRPSNGAVWVILFMVVLTFVNLIPFFKNDGQGVLQAAGFTREEYKNLSDNSHLFVTLVSWAAYFFALREGMVSHPLFILAMLLFWTLCVGYSQVSSHEDLRPQLLKARRDHWAGLYVLLVLATMILFVVLLVLNHPSIPHHVHARQVTGELSNALLWIHHFVAKIG